MAWTTRLLVVANRTAGSDELSNELHRRAEAGPIHATVVLPAPIGHEAEAREHLASVIDRARGTGIEIDGAIGDADPVNAALDVWDARKFDEIVVCTLPPGESTWLHIDLPHRLRRMTDATVSHVVARMPEPAGGHAAPAVDRQPWFARLFPVNQRGAR